MSNLYLYDFAFHDVFNQTNLLVFGYMKVEQVWRKVELHVQNFDITLNLSVDCNIFKQTATRSETCNMVENYLYNSSNKQNLRNIVLDYKEKSGFLPFKGAQSIQNNQKIVEFEFRSFKDYDTFQRKINNINESIIDKFKNTNDGNDNYVQGLLFKELLYLHQFLINEKSLYTQEQIQYKILSDIIEQFDKFPDKCAILLEQCHMQLRSNAKYSNNLNDVDDLFDKLKTNCKYTPILTKYPFRILENDTKNNYILKLLRHSNCQISGFNRVNLNSQIEIPEDPTSRIQLSCNSLEDIVFEPAFEPNTNPLTLLAWDIEVCTQSGKFDNDGTNDLNKVLCIGMSFGLLQQGTSNKQRIGVCVTWVDSKDNQLSLLEFESIYKQYLKDQESTGLLHQYVVRSSNESQMIKDFFSLVNLFDPSFITGFNDFQFDFPFIKDKISLFATKGIRNDIQDILQRGFMFKSNNNLFQSQSIKINASDNKAGISLNVNGIISIDTRILLMKTQKLEKKSLNDYLLANNLPVKLDVSFRDMNRAFKAVIDQQQTESDINNNQLSMDSAKQILSDVFKYCMYDSEACCLLWQKRNILQQAVEVSKLSFTPLKYSFLNADGIKVRNMVAKFAFDRKFCVPMTNNSHDIRIRDIECLHKYEKYPGAYVSPPKKGISTTPVSALDFESLYPSIIMAHNLSPEKVIEPFEIIPYSTKTTQIAIPFAKDDMSEILEGNVLTRDSGVGIYPEILKYLFDSRKQVKKQMEHIAEQADSTDDPIVKKELEFQTTLLNCKQLAIKVFMNTFYGETGNQKSPLFDVLISGGTTTLGQKYIRQVHSFIEEQDCEIVYGDSIVGDEPLLLQDQHGFVHIKTIESLMFAASIGQYGLSKQQTSSDFNIWVYDKWVPIKRVIRHKVNKDIYRVCTGNSIVEVTEDHSLIDTSFQQVSPLNCDILDTQILQGFPQVTSDTINVKSQITKLQSTKLYIMGILFDYKEEIPNIILNAPVYMKKLFLNGVLHNSTIMKRVFTSKTLIDVPFAICRTKLMSQQIYFLMQQTGYYPSVEITQYGNYLIKINKTPILFENLVINKKHIKKSKVLYVYDIETDLGMFGAGIGQMTLKNTDSVYFRPRYSHFALYKQQKELELRQQADYVPNSVNSITYKEINDISADMLQSAYDATERLKVEINRRIGDQTSGFLKLAFEELLYPSMFTGKKKYCGVVYVPGKMIIKPKLTIKDILLRGIDFIKSQYPQIIKQVGQQTLISIMEYFMDNIKGFGVDQLQEIFKDTYRDNLNTQLKDLVSSQILNLNTRLLNIKPEEYHLLASKKKLRSTKTGQMMLFRQRLVDNQDTNHAFIYNSLKELVLQINISELQQSGIDVPEDGEILDLISINPPSVMPKLKASELIHLLQYTQQKKLPINVQEYLKMYRTTASRILVSAFFDNQINDPDQQEKQALKDAKKFCDDCSIPITQLDAIDAKYTLMPNTLQCQILKLQTVNCKIIGAKAKNNNLYVNESLHDITNLMNETRLKLDTLIDTCITRVFNDNGQYRLIDEHKLLQYIDTYLTVNPLHKSTLYSICNLEQIKLKLEFCLEQAGISGSFVQLQKYIQHLQRLMENYQDSHLLLVVFRVVVLLQNHSDTKISIDCVKSFLDRIVYISNWNCKYQQLMVFINRYNKIPGEMSELYNWLFKQKTTYIEISKVINKKKKIQQDTQELGDKDTKNLQSAIKDIPTAIPGFIGIQSIINTQLIQKHDIIKKFFEESIWDLEYQQYKTNPVQLAKWSYDQVELYKKGLLKQTHILKIMKVNPDIHI